MENLKLNEILQKVRTTYVIWHNM